MRRGRVGGQMYRVLILALIIPMIIIGGVSAFILMGQMKDRYGGAVLVIPLFRQESREGAGKDVEITPAVCKGLRYSEYAQPMNLKKIKRNQIVRRIGHVKDETVHDSLLSSIWNQIDKSGEGLR